MGNGNTESCTSGKMKSMKCVFQTKTTITMSFQKTVFLSVHTTEINASALPSCSTQ